jgi:hypothetical protein
LFHDIVVAKSREIYESLMDENMGGNEAQGFVQELTQQDDQAQDMGLGEDDLEGGDIELDGGDDEFGDEETFGDDGEMGMGGEEGEHAEITSKLDDLEAQLADLKAMLGDEGAEHDDMGGDDMGSEEGESDFDMDGGEEGSGKSGSGSAEGEEDGMMEAMGSGMSGSGMSGSGKSGSGKMESANPFAKSGSGKSGSGKSGSGASGSGKSGSGKMEGRTYRKSEVEIMKEYVDKIGEIYKQEPASGEGKTVGTGGDEPTINHKSIEGPGADFGGTNENIAKGGSNENPDGKQFKAPNNEYTKKRGELPGAGQFKNVPGGDAGKTSFKTKEPGHGAEKKSGPEGKLVGSDGSNPINKTSVQKQNTGRK